MKTAPLFVTPVPQLAVLPVAGSDHLYPVRRIYCVGRNYLEHIREMGGDERELPFFFQKPADSIVQHGSQIPYPGGTQDFQHEVELVMAISTAGADIAPERARDHVFGLAVGIDLTRRDVQVQARKAGRPWEIGKSFDRSAPCSAIVPLSPGVPLPTSGAIQLEVNGQVRQAGDLAQLIWPCCDIVAQLSRQYELQPGDLIYTGTPSGVGPLQPGDRVLARVEGVGELGLNIGPATLRA